MPSPDTTSSLSVPVPFAGARTFRVRGGFTGLKWSPVADRLLPQAREALRRELVPVALETFDGTAPEFWLDWLSDASLDAMQGLVVVLDEHSRPAAWVASNRRTFGGRRCFYANSAGVHPRHQGAGLSSAIWRALLKPEIARAAPHRLYAVMRTGNPLVYGAWSAVAGPDKTFPSPGRDVPEQVRAVAVDAARELGQLERLDPRTLVIRDAYDSSEAGLWRHRPRSDRPEVDAWFDELLAPRDAVVLIVAFDPVSMIWGEAARVLARRFGLSAGRSSRRSAKRR